MSTCNGSSPRTGVTIILVQAVGNTTLSETDKLSLQYPSTGGDSQRPTDSCVMTGLQTQAPGQFYLDRAMGVASGDPAKRPVQRPFHAWLGGSGGTGSGSSSGPLLDGDWALLVAGESGIDTNLVRSGEGEWVATSAWREVPASSPAGCQVPLRDRVGTIPGTNQGGINEGASCR